MKTGRFARGLWPILLAVAVLMAFCAPAFTATRWQAVSMKLPTTFTAGETLAVGDAVCVKEADGKLYKADSNDAALRPCIGFAYRAASANGTGVQVVTRGILGGQTALTKAGYEYLSETAGAVTQTAPATVQILGYALTTTTIGVDVHAIYPALTVGTNGGPLPSTGVANAHVAADAAIAGSKLQALSVGANAGVLPSTGVANAHVAADAAIAGSKLAAKARTHTVKSRLFNVDNGSGTTLDDVIIRPTSAITITSAKVVAATENFGTVNAATIQLGTTVTGVDIVAAVGLTNDLAVGAAQNLTLASAAVAANTPLIARHTGLATTVAGEYYVMLEYTVDD